MGYEEFSVLSGVDGKRYDCRFHTLIIGIAPRHSDTADVKFLVSGKPLVVALPLPAYAEHSRRGKKPLNDADTIQMAGLFLKESLEREGLPEGRELRPTAAETLNLAARIQSLEPAAQAR